VTSFGAFEIGGGRSAVASGERLVLGIRPSDIRVAETDAIETRVQLVEPQGDVTVISLSSEDATLRLILPEQKASGYVPGDIVRVALDRDKVHLFRRHDGAAIR
jgi:multiple sugar transport system ATP-binding protein